MTPSAQVADGRRVRRWTRDTIIEKIREWNDRYGEPPCSADWNPSLARWRAQEWRAERYREGVWPSTNAAKRPFGGSFDAAVRAAGLEPHRPGPRRRAAGVARPDVEQRAPQAPRSVDDELIAAADRLAAGRGARRRCSSAGCALPSGARSGPRTRIGEARRRARRATEREGRARRARDRVQVAERLDARARPPSGRGARRRRRGADPCHVRPGRGGHARRDRRAPRAAPAEARAADAEQRAEAAERLGAAARAELACAGRRRGVEGGRRGRGARRRGRAPRARARGARVRRGAPPDRGRARRRSAPAAPSGPAVLAAALREVARARASGNGPALDAALSALASAAVRWRDRL